MACLEKTLSFFPGVSGQQYQNGENFQTAGQHGPTQHQLAQVAECGEIAGGANGFQTGTDVVEGTQNSGKIGADRKTVQGNDRENCENDDHISGKIGICVGKNLLVYDLSVIADQFYLPGGEHLADIPAQTFH